MEPKRIYRDESTPDRKEIWTFVERAAARADGATVTEKPSSDQRQATPQFQTSRSGRE